ncbi:type IV secretion system protein [Ehrlichia muris]|uniref:Conjugal transfer protein n=1 Tax=Ehrlichia muris AS145 TaxID=1423892 RepID=V9R674_9RICK|nr:type IV secretion system protein [Ehrlichia muris]AHC39305.1 conjugal transfer protein [Ehrlichia muris AS145]
MCDFIKKNFIKLLLFLVITACESNQHPVPRCIPADMLSETKTASVSAYFAPQSEDFVSDDQLLGDSIKNDQVVRWKYTGYVTDGRPIILRAEGMWTAWVDQSNANNVSSIVLDEEELDHYNDILSVERICGPYNKIEKTFVPNGQAACKVSCELISGVKDDLERGAYGPPCWFKNGYGAYLLFKRPNDPDPNQTLNNMRYPVSPVMHIGYKPLELAGNDVYSTKNKPIMDSLCQKVTLEPGWKIYVKILDKCYYDNVGGYAITFIEGVKTEKQFSVFEWVRKQIRGELDKAGEKIFKHIVGNPVFKNFVFSLLTLFLLFGALAYIFGIVQSPFGDIIVRVLKVSLIILLISPSSWEFFYNHLLSLFIHGIDQIIAIINSHASAYNPKEPLAFLDDMIVNKIFSPVIWKIKIRALIIADFSSIFAVCVIIIAIFLYIALCIYGFVIYLTAFVGITFLVGLFPLLLLGILFSQFKHLFDGWLTQCISFAMQAILIFTLISLFGALIMNYYYRIFGFTTCYNEWLKVRVCLLGNLGCILDKGVFGWTPGQVYDPKIIGFPPSADIFMDRKLSGNARYQFTGGGAYIDVPPDRKYKDFRYLDYPFLDPDTKTDGNPFGVNVSQSSPFRQLSYYINALLSSKKRYVAARLIKDIEDELDVLEKKQVINSVSKNKVLQIIQERRAKDKLEQKSELDKYKDEDFKFQVINSIINDIMAGAIQDPTPQEELNKQYDYNLILRIRAGYLILWTEVGSLFLAALLIWQMRAFIQSVAVSLAGGSMMSQTLASMYEGGFIRIFSGIPVVGVVFEKIDQGIDSFKFVTGNYVTRVARMPLNTLRSIPYLGKAVKFTAGATDVLTSSYNEHDRNFSNSFRKLNYARAFIGAHLGFSPLDAMKYLGGHIVGKALGYREGNLIRNAIEDRQAVLDSLKAHMLGPEKYKPSPYIPNNKEEDDDKNPFAKERSHKAGSSTLLDDDGNVYVNKENLKDALEAREQLKTMLDNTKDDTALRNIKYDIDRLDNALRQHLDDKFDDVIQSYANSRDLIPHPQDLLPENLSMLRTPSEGEISGVSDNTALSDMIQMYNDTQVDNTLDVVSPVSGTRSESLKQDSEGAVKDRTQVFTGSADISEHDVSPMSDTKSESLKQDSEGAVKDRVESSTDFIDTPKDVVSPMSDTKSEILEQDLEDNIKGGVKAVTDLDMSQYSASLEEGIESKDLGIASDETSMVKDPAEVDIAQVHSDAETSVSLDVSKLQNSVDDSIRIQDDVERLQESVLSQEDVELKDHISEITGYDGDDLSSETASEENNTMLMQNVYDEQQSISLSPEEKSDLYSETEKDNESGLSVLADNATTEDVEQEAAEDTSKYTNKLDLDYNVLDVGELEKDLDSTDIESDKTLQQFSVESGKEVDDNSIFKQGEDDRERLQQSDAEVSSTLSVEPYDISTSERVDDEKMHDYVPYDSELGNKGDVVTQESDLDQSNAGSTDDTGDGAVDHAEETVPESSEELEDANESDDQVDNETDGVDDEELKIEETDDVSDQSDNERDYESGDGEFSNNAEISDVEGLINVATTSEENVIAEGLQQYVQPNIQSNAMSLKKDKDVVVDKNISSDKLDIKDVGIVKEKKKESGESKADNAGKAKSAKTAVNRKSLKKTLKVILNQCTNDLSAKFWLSIDKIFEDSKSGKQKRKLSKQDILLMIRQLEAVIASLKDRKRHLTDINEIREIEASIKEAESTIKNLLGQE